jgi:hypothetical protein
MAQFHRTANVLSGCGPDSKPASPTATPKAAAVPWLANKGGFMQPKGALDPTAQSNNDVVNPAKAGGTAAVAGHSMIRSKPSGPGGPVVKANARPFFTQALLEGSPTTGAVAESAAVIIDLIGAHSEVPRPDGCGFNMFVLWARFGQHSSWACSLHRCCKPADPARPIARAACCRPPPAGLRRLCFCSPLARQRWCRLHRPQRGQRRAWRQRRRRRCGAVCVCKGDVVWAIVAQPGNHA